MMYYVYLKIWPIYFTLTYGVKEDIFSYDPASSFSIQRQELTAILQHSSPEVVILL